MAQLISVIMPAYNVEHYVAEAIDSILNQTFRDFELIISNDASTDNTLWVIQRYHDPRIRVISHHHNLGYEENMNFLFQEAKCDVIVVQDADDYSAPNRLSYLFDFLTQNPQVSLVGSSYFKVDDFGLKELIPVTSSIEWIKESFDQMRDPLPVVNWCMLRKEIIEQGFLFRKLNYVNRGQDDDWMFRISEKFIMANVPEPLYYYRSNPASMTLNPSYITYNSLSAGDYVRFIKARRVATGIDVLDQKKWTEIDHFFNEKKKILTQNQPAYLESYIAHKYLGMGDRFNGLKWLLKALIKNPKDMFFWKKIVYVLVSK